MEVNYDMSNLMTLMKKFEVRFEKIEKLLSQSGINSPENVGTETDFLDATVRSTKVSNNRDQRKSRNSIFNFSPLKAEDEDDGKSDSTSQPTIIIAARDIREDEKIRKLSIRSVKKLLTDIYPTHLATSHDRTKKFAHFLPVNIREDLVNDQKKKGTTIGLMLTSAELLNLSDEVTKRIIADYLRPKSRHQYIMEMYTHTDNLSGMKFDFKVKGYEKYMHSKVNKILDEIENYDEFFRYNATEAELERFPELEWGSTENPGVFRIVMHCFKPYDENFKQLIKVSKLKKCSSMHDFIDLFKAVNDDLARKSEALLVQDEAMQTQEKLAELHEQAQTAVIHKKFHDGVHEKAKLGHLKQLEQHKPLYEDYTEELVSEDEFLSDEEEKQLLKLSHEKASFNKAKTARDIPCFSAARTGKCDKANEGGCSYSHDPRVLRAFIAKEVQKLTASPYYVPSADQPKMTPRKHLAVICHSSEENSTTESSEEA